MQEKLGALVRTQAMQLFRQQGLHFTMQQVAEPLQGFGDRKSTRLNSSHANESRMPSSA